jgi:hypothetical protein
MVRVHSVYHFEKSVQNTDVNHLFSTQIGSAVSAGSACVESPGYLSVDVALKQQRDTIGQRRATVAAQWGGAAGIVIRAPMLDLAHAVDRLAFVKRWQASGFLVALMMLSEQALAVGHCTPL